MCEQSISVKQLKRIKKKNEEKMKTSVFFIKGEKNGMVENYSIGCKNYIVIVSLGMKTF